MTGVVGMVQEALILPSCPLSCLSGVRSIDDYSLGGSLGDPSSLSRLMSKDIAQEPLSRRIRINTMKNSGSPIGRKGTRRGRRTIGSPKPLYLPSPIHVSPSPPSPDLTLCQYNSPGCLSNTPDDLREMGLSNCQLPAPAMTLLPIKRKSGQLHQEEPLVPIPVRNETPLKALIASPNGSATTASNTPYLSSPDSADAHYFGENRVAPFCPVFPASPKSVVTSYDLSSSSIGSLGSPILPPCSVKDEGLYHHQSPYTNPRVSLDPLQRPSPSPPLIAIPCMKSRNGQNIGSMGFGESPKKVTGRPSLNILGPKGSLSGSHEKSALPIATSCGAQSSPRDAHPHLHLYKDIYLYLVDDFEGFYHLGDFIGDGSEGYVRSCTPIQDSSHEYAVKITPKDSMHLHQFHTGFRYVDDLDGQRHYAAHIYEMSQVVAGLRHKSVLNYIAFYEDLQNYYILMEKAKGPALFDYLVNKVDVNEEDCREVFRQALEALQYIHSKGLVHRDVKPENFVFRDPLESANGWQLLLIDFGIACYEADISLFPPSGTSMYMAPEIFLAQKQYTGKVDIWAAGILLCMLLTGSSPFGTAGPYEYLERIEAEEKRANVVVFEPVGASPATQTVTPFNTLSPSPSRRGALLSPRHFPFEKWLEASPRRSHRDAYAAISRRSDARDILVRLRSEHSCLFDDLESPIKGPVPHWPPIDSPVARCSGIFNRRRFSWSGGTHTPDAKTLIRRISMGSGAPDGHQKVSFIARSAAISTPTKVRFETSSFRSSTSGVSPLYSGCGRQLQSPSEKPNLRNSKRLKGELFSLKTDLESESWKHISNSAKSLVMSLLTANPVERPTATEALSHAWFADVSPKSSVLQKKKFPDSIVELWKGVSRGADQGLLRQRTMEASWSPSNTPDSFQRSHTLEFDTFRSRRLQKRRGSTRRFDLAQ